MARTPSAHRDDSNSNEHENDLQKEDLAIMQQVERDTAVADAESANELIKCEPQDRQRLLIQHFGKRLDILGAHGLESLDGQGSADHYVSGLRAYKRSLLIQLEKISPAWPPAIKDSVLPRLKLLLNARVLHWTAEGQKRIQRSPNEQDPLAEVEGGVESSAKLEPSRVRSGQHRERKAKITVEWAALAEYQRRMLKKFGKDTMQDRYRADYVTGVSIMKHLRIDHSRFYKALRHEIPDTWEAKTLMKFLEGNELPKPTPCDGKAPPSSLSIKTKLP
jgi:hypothetical protein